MFHKLFTHFTVYGYLDNFQFEAIINSITMRILVYAVINPSDMSDSLQPHEL